MPIPNAISFTFSPNPASALLALNITSKKETVLLTIASDNGKIMVEKRLFTNKGPYHQQFDISKFPTGIYHIHLQAGNDHVSGKFLKE